MQIAVIANGKEVLIADEKVRRAVKIEMNE